MFEIGKKVVYPMHGAGIIVNIEEQEISGQACPYYVVNLVNNEMQVLIPVEKACDLGLRGINGKAQFEKVYNVLENDARSLPDNWNHRYRANLEKLKSGNIEEMAEVIKDLHLRDREKGLSTGEKKMLENALEILISEISLSSDIEKGKARQELFSHLEK